jgi:hypothetical protein
MVISLNDCICAINPERILYIEYCRRPVSGRLYPGLDLSLSELHEYKINPDDEIPGTEEFCNCITIYLTDNQQISYTIEKQPDAYFERLRRELPRFW